MEVYCRPKRARESKPLLTVVYESKKDRERVQILLENIKHRLRKTNGEIIEEALNQYYKLLKVNK
jgi:hypothetical protein